MPELCPVCLAKGRNNVLMLDQLSYEEACQHCSDDKCTYPFGSDGLIFQDNFFVKRSFRTMTKSDFHPVNHKPNQTPSKELDKEQLKFLTKILRKVYNVEHSKMAEEDLILENLIDELSLNHSVESNKESGSDELMDLLKCDEMSIDSGIYFDPDSFDCELDFLSAGNEENKPMFDVEDINEGTGVESPCLPPATRRFSSLQRSDTNESSIDKEIPIKLTDSNNISGYNPKPWQQSCSDKNLTDSDYTFPVSEVIVNEKSTPISIVEENPIESAFTNNVLMFTQDSPVNNVSVNGCNTLLQHSDINKKCIGGLNPNPLKQSVSDTTLTGSDNIIHLPHVVNEESSCVPIEKSVINNTSIEKNKLIQNHHSPTKTIACLDRNSDFDDCLHLSKAESLVNDTYTVGHSRTTSEDENSNCIKVQDFNINDISSSYYKEIYFQQSSVNITSFSESVLTHTHESFENSFSTGEFSLKTLQMSDKQEQEINVIHTVVGHENGLKENYLRSEGNDLDRNLNFIDEKASTSGEQTAALLMNKSSGNGNFILESNSLDQCSSMKLLGTSQNGSETKEISTKNKTINYDQNMTVESPESNTIQFDALPHVLRSHNSHVQIKNSVQACKNGKIVGNVNLDPAGSENCLDSMKQSLPSAEPIERSFESAKCQESFDGIPRDLDTDIDKNIHIGNDDSFYIFQSAVSSHPLEVENSVIKDNFTDTTKINHIPYSECEGTIEDPGNTTMCSKDIDHNDNASGTGAAADEGKNDVGCEHMDRVSEKSNFSILHDHLYFRNSNERGLNSELHVIENNLDHNDNASDTGVAAEEEKNDVDCEHMDRVSEKSNSSVLYDHLYFRNTNGRGLNSKLHIIENNLDHNGSRVESLNIKSSILPAAAVMSERIPTTQMKINSTVHLSSNNNVGISLIPSHSKNYRSLKSSSVPRINVNNCNSSITSCVATKSKMGITSGTSDHYSHSCLSDSRNNTKSDCHNGTFKGDKNVQTRNSYNSTCVLANASDSVEQLQNLEVVQFSSDCGDVALKVLPDHNNAEVGALEFCHTEGGIYQENVGTSEACGANGGKSHKQRRKCTKDNFEKLNLKDLQFKELFSVFNIEEETVRKQQKCNKHKKLGVKSVLTKDHKLKNVLQTGQNCNVVVVNWNKMVQPTVPRNMPITYLPVNSQFQQGIFNPNLTHGVSYSHSFSPQHHTSCSLPIVQQNTLSSKTVENHHEKVTCNPQPLNTLPNKDASFESIPVNIDKNTLLSAITEPLNNSLSKPNAFEDKQSMLNSGITDTESQLVHSKKSELSQHGILGLKTQYLKEKSNENGLTNFETFEGFSFEKFQDNNLEGKTSLDKDDFLMKRRRKKVKSKK